MSYSIAADVIVQNDANGIIMQQGGHFGGYALGIKNGKPFFAYNVLALSTTEWKSEASLTPGDHKIVFTFKSDGGIGKGGSGTLLVDGKIVAQNRMEMSIPVLVPIDEGFSVTRGNVTPVSHEYQTPFDFNGVLSELVINRIPDKLTPAQQQKLEDELGEAWATLE